MADREIIVPGRFMLHSYYTLCPYAPDGSGRILAAGCDLETEIGEVYILSPEGEVIDSFGRQKVSNSFYHTGFWQAWSPDARYVYYAASDGDVLHPKIGVYEVETGKTVYCDGDFEGAPPLGEPIFCGLHSMLYAAGYGTGKYTPSLSPIPFEERDKHGLFKISPLKGENVLALPVSEAMHLMPMQERLAAEDERLKDIGGLTMMAYCVRYSRDGKKLLFFLGNHCVDKRRGEPKIATVFTADRDLTNIHLAVDLSFGKNGVHWGWCADGEHLIGYGPKPGGEPKEICLATVRYDGTGYRMISSHNSGGHPSVSPIDNRLVVTDEKTKECGYVVFINAETGETITKVKLPKFNYEKGAIPPGRNRFYICHHPVFSHDGKKVLCNQMVGRHSAFYEIDVYEHLKGVFE